MTKLDDEGFEPSTFRMQNGRSTTELNAHVSVCSGQCIFRSIEVSIPACHAGDPGSIPGGRELFQGGQGQQGICPGRPPGSQCTIAMETLGQLLAHMFREAKKCEVPGSN